MPPPPPSLFRTILRPFRRPTPPPPPFSSSSSSTIPRPISTTPHPPRLLRPNPTQPNHHRPQSPPPSFFLFKFARAFLWTLLPVTPIVLVFREHVVSTYPVGGPSMAPYLNARYGVEDLARETVVVSKLGRGWWAAAGGNGGLLRRGMVVMFRSPRNPEVLAIKRIIGLPGDEVTPRPSPSPSSSPSHSSTSFSHSPDDATHPTHPQIVPYNHVWVEGDANDTAKSLDSNTYGPISMSLITGRVVGVIWPWERRRLLRWELWDPPAGSTESSGEDAKKICDEAERWREGGGEMGRSQRMRVRKNVISVQAPFVS
ncbi:hypothetical protein PRK78_004592 [Emydomyces testavorans]|uniref:Mitochondrial inner membrane protease subunit n=1 Tax=Emydomyces testavorans TaxID=2070801 RepID=A0AAF0DJ28_9EURO|nr:hypothetical protein PRK78_004592 [Emydomyces testavorans]